MWIGALFFVGLPLMYFIGESGLRYMQLNGKGLPFIIAVIDAFIVAITFGHIKDFKEALFWKDTQGNTEFNGVFMGALALTVNIAWALLLEP